jgi:hypothetical protein
MIVGVSKVICTCNKEMIRTGGVFGEVCSYTYYCNYCKKYVLVITPNDINQKEFSERIKKE